MAKTLSYRARLLLNFSIVFVCFTLMVIAFQYYRSVDHSRDMLEVRLESFAEIVERQLQCEGGATDEKALTQLKSILPEQLSYTIISVDGKVMFDSNATDVNKTPNHKGDREVVEALSNGEGSDIRESKSLHKPYIYYAKLFPDNIVRVALPYDDQVHFFADFGDLLLWLSLLLFPIVIVALIYVSGRFGRAIAGLRHFIDSAERGLMDYDNITFPKNDLGDIAAKVLKKYKELEEKTRQVNFERERLMKHFHFFEDGIAIFSPQRQKIFSNPRFLQYVNTILDVPTASVNTIWENEALRPIRSFLDECQTRGVLNSKTSVFRDTLHAGGLHFAIQVLVYSDNSFEITLSDITETEKNRLLKQQMSHNISHELRTPVSSIKGFLETLVNCENLSAERRMDFLQRALLQVERLSELIRDVALISKIEEAAATLPREDINLCQLIEETVEELQEGLSKQRMTVVRNVPVETTIQGNYSLLHSIFRNLLENSIRYAGVGTMVDISCYKKNTQFLYFRFYNNGKSIPEECLPRLFERFYRVSEGRTRDCGGTGLGLSIVKNAVNFHSGDIIVKSQEGRGVEFLFTLKRN